MRKYRKSLFFLVLVAVIGTCLFGLFSSCSKQPAGGKKKVTVTYMMWGQPDELETVSKYIEQFKKKYPNIDVKILHSPSMGYDDKLKTMMAGGTPPDVMYIGLEAFPTYVVKGELLDLTPFIERDKLDVSTASFYPHLNEQFMYKGRYYGIAKDFATLVLYYNKDMFDKEGIPYPTNNWTWQDFRKAAERLTKDIDGDGKIDQYGFVLETWMGEWLPWVWQNGGEVMDPTKRRWLLGDPKYIDKNAEALDFLADLVWGPKPVAPKPTVTQDLGTSEMFKTGKVAMCTYGRWMCMEFKHIKDFRWDIQVLPYNKRRATTLFTVCYAISSKTKHPEEAWTLLKYLVSPEGQIPVAESGHAIPSLRAIAESDHFLKAPVLPPDLNHKANLEGIPYMRPTPTNPVFNEAITIINREMDYLWRGKKKAREVILAIQPQVEKVFSQLAQYE